MLVWVRTCKPKMVKCKLFFFACQKAYILRHMGEKRRRKMIVLLGHVMVKLKFVSFFLGTFSSGVF